MGKRKGGLTGLSRFVLESFKAGSQPVLPEPTIQGDRFAVSTDLVAPGRSPDDRPAKRRKTETRTSAVVPGTQLGDAVVSQSKWIEKYDATGLVPHYTHASQVPDHLHKYFSQRTRFFYLYSTPPGCLLDEEGWYSITPELIANQIAERCRCDTILDAFCGVGGNAIAFAKTCQRVIALDTSPTRLALARHNAQIYGVADRIEFILSDYISFAHSYLSLPPSREGRRIDVIFLSPPWGGPSYLSRTAVSTPFTDTSTTGNRTTSANDVPNEEPTSADLHPSYSLASIQPIHGADLFYLSRRITQNIAYYLPRNTRLEDISALLVSESAESSMESTASDGDEANPTKRDDDGDGGKVGDKEWVEVEEEWMGTKLKALTCYFGGLADGQGDLF